MLERDLFPSDRVSLSHEEICVSRNGERGGGLGRAGTGDKRKGACKCRCKSVVCMYVCTSFQLSLATT